MFNKIQKRQDIANYLCVQQMYLNEYCEIKEIDISKMKKTPRGHWGCIPAINFCYSNIAYNHFFDNAYFVLGTGHGGGALIVNSFLDETLNVVGMNFSKTQDGLNFLISSFGENFGIRSEANPAITNVRYTGGELGYALSYSYGFVYNEPEKVVFCFIGDGECETGTTASSFILNTALRNKKNGLVVPIINLNKFKMGGKSLLSSLSKSQIKSYFKAFNFDVIFVKSNEDMQIALNKVEETIRKDKSIVPLIVLDFEKGFTAPNDKDVSFVGTSKSHKDVLTFYDEKTKIKYLKMWLQSYKVNTSDILCFKSCVFNTNYKDKDVLINEFDFMSDVRELSNSAKMFSKCVYEFHKKNSIILVSPDELVSNKFDSAKLSEIDHFEILNENICQGLMQGFSMSYKQSICYCYESFMPIVSSMISQYLKQLYESSIYSSNKYPSLNYFITSVCWENCYSHQNPEIYSTLLAKDYKNINCLFPIDAISVKTCFDEVMKTTNSVNLICFSKQERQAVLTINQANRLVRDGYLITNNQSKPDYILFALGDLVYDYMQKQKEKLEGLGKKVKCVYIYNPAVLKNINTFRRIINNCKNVMFYNHGYTSMVEADLIRINPNIKIYGYKDKSYLTYTTFEKIEKNFKL